jgi:hypothetical protein
MITFSSCAALNTDCGIGLTWAGTSKISFPSSFLSLSGAGVLGTLGMTTPGLYLLTASLI